MTEAPATTAPPSLLLDDAELFMLTRYKVASKQLQELHRQGFYRARVQHGHLILERAHYDDVCRGGTTTRPYVKPPPQVRPPSAYVPVKAK